ncbi:MAG: YgjV family protein [Clostridia bacterium]|nr:YgjV family protein [Clostridia bacterium]
MNFIIAQILGIVVTIICIIMTHFKKMSHVLVSEFAANALTAVQYFILGGISGSYMCIVASVHTFVMTALNKYCKNNIRIKRNIIFGIFISIYLLIAVLLYSGIRDIFSIISSVLFSFMVVQSKSSKYRALNLIKTFSLLFYDLYTHAFTNIFTRLFTAISCSMAICRLDLNVKLKKV